MQNRLSLLKKERKRANGWIKALSKKRKNLDRLSVKNVDFFSGLKAIIVWQIEKAFSWSILVRASAMQIYIIHTRSTCSSEGRNTPFFCPHRSLLPDGTRQILRVGTGGDYSVEAPLGIQTMGHVQRRWQWQSESARFALIPNWVS